MKQLLILTDLYPPLFSPRIAYLTQYIQQWGWSPIVFTGSYSGSQVFSEFTHPCPVHYAPLPCRSTIKHHILGVLDLLWQQKEIDFARFVEQTYQEYSYPRPDIILCFTHRQFPLTAANHLANQWGIPWVADCRDIVEQYSDAEFLPRPINLWGYRLRWMENLLKKHYIRIRNRAFSSATAIVTVSRWHQQVLQQIHPAVHLIYNGFDAQLFFPQNISIDTFRIVYTGRLHSVAMRNPELLFQALALPQIAHLPIELLFYTDNASVAILEQLANRYNEKRMRFCLMVEHKRIPEILSLSSLILLLGNEPYESGPQGMVSTKIFEAMAMHKPTLLLPSVSGEAVDILQRSGIGIASDKAEEIATFILKHYQAWQEAGYTLSYQADDNFIKQFSREQQAKEFSDLMKSIL